MNRDMNRKQILVTGKHGQVGWELCRTLSTIGNVVAIDQSDADFTQPSELERLVRTVKPDIIVNAAAYTAVDRAESEPELAMAINGTAPRILARQAQRLGALFVHYSTDYIFDGTAATPYTEESAPNPKNVYGQTKLAGEHAVQEEVEAHFIFRTSWVYGSRGKNFLLTMLRLALERDQLSVVADQIGAPTWSRTLAEATGQVIAQTLLTPGRWGTYNLTNSGATSWHAFAEEIFRQRVAQCAAMHHAPFPLPTVSAIATAQYPTPASRPLNSRLSCEKFYKTFGLCPPPWEKALALCLEEVALGATASCC